MEVDIIDHFLFDPSQAPFTVLFMPFVFSLCILSPLCDSALSFNFCAFLFASVPACSDLFPAECCCWLMWVGKGAGAAAQTS